MPIIVKGEGHHIWDSTGKKYIDGLTGLFVVNAGHGRRRLAEVGARSRPRSSRSSRSGRTRTRPRSSSPTASPTYAPGDLNRVFFSTGGGEAVETAFKLAKHYWKLQGQPTKHKVISRSVAYHGTPQGALAITGIPAMKSMFEPVVARRLPRAEHELLPRGGDGLHRRPPRRSSACGRRTASRR